MIKEIKKIVTDFCGTIDIAVEAREKAKAENNGKYLPDIAVGRNEKIDKAFMEEIAPFRERTIARVKIVLEKMTDYLQTGIAYVDTKALSELRALDGVELSEFELETIKNRFKNNYWALRLLANRYEKEGNTVTEILENSQSFRPQPEKYYAIFDEIMNAVENIIQNYDGKITLSSVSPEAIKSMMILNGSFFEDIEERINSLNPCYFITDFVKYHLDQEEENKLSVFLGKFSGNSVYGKLHWAYSTNKVDEDIADILSRSQYRNTWKLVLDEYGGENPFEKKRQKDKIEMMVENEWLQKYMLLE